MIPRVRTWAALHPLARIALAAVAGAAAADRGLCGQHETAVFVAAVAACFCVWLRPRWFPVEIPAILVFGFVHLVRLSETANHPLRSELQDGKRSEALVTGYLTPVIAPGAGGDGSRQQVTFDARSITLTMKGRRLAGTACLRAWFSSKVRLPAPGTYEISGLLRLPQRPSNPGQFDSAAYALRQGFVADLDVRSARLLKADPLPLRTWFMRTAGISRDWISAQLEKGIENEEHPVALIRGMVLGLTDETSADLQRPFRNTGTLHVFSVSGLHVALISSIGWMFLGACGIKRTAAMALLIPAVFAYAFITGWHPPAARAAIMVALVMAAALFDRRARLQNSLGAAALILLASDTQPLFTAGFQLSFGVLWAIALFAAPLLHLLRPWSELDPFLPPQIASPGQRLSAQVRAWLAGTVSVSAAATFGSLPLMLWHFGLATPVSLIANCLLIPLAFCVLATACVSLGFAAVHAGIAQVLSNNANWLFAKAMLHGATFFADVPGAWFIWQPGPSTARPRAELVVLHLPYGEAAQSLRIEDACWLLDTGTKRSFTRAVQPLLQYQGTAQIKGIVLSHSDIDHVGGISRALDEYPQTQVLLGILEPWRRESGTSSLKRFLASPLPRRTPPPRLIGADDAIDLAPGAHAAVLYPSRRDLHDKGDDRALVLLVEIDGFRILWLNDAGFIAEKTIMERRLLKSLRCDVLIRNQHAADFSALAEFLLAVRPKIIITSNVPFVAGQTMPSSLAGYASKKHAAIFDQDTAGAVTIAIDDHRLTATAFSTGQVVTLEKTPPKRTDASR
ncbi:MAG: ComEC/Rec2 family competence protein [Verrucomicrobiaceae bacterium]|nr:ComEC/Rec2 family competence protein [Verrucomicrobiaceae bacterium]